jgi:hypothetical protein
MPTILETIIAAYKNPTTERLKLILSQADALLLAQEATSIQTWLDKQRTRLDKFHADLGAMVEKQVNIGHEFLNITEDHIKKSELDTVIQSFLQSAAKLGMTTQEQQPDFSHLVKGFDTSYTQYLLASLPLCHSILSNATSDQLVRNKKGITDFCSALQERVKNHWDKQHPEDETDYRKILLHLFLLNALEALLSHNIHSKSIQMEAIIQWWRNVTGNEPLINLLATSSPDQEVKAFNICSTISRLHNIEMEIDDFCRATLEKAESATQAFINAIGLDCENKTNEDIKDILLHLVTTVKANGLDLLGLCKTLEPEDSTPWITFYSNLFSQLTYAVHLTFNKIHKIDSKEAEIFKANIILSYRENKTIHLMCLIYQSAIQKFLDKPSPTDVDTPEFFQSNLQAVSGVSSLRTEINIYTLVTTFAMHLELLLKSLGIADIPDSKAGSLNLQNYLNTLLTCWSDYNPNPTSTATLTSRLGSRPGSPATVPEASLVTAHSGGGGGK